MQERPAEQEQHDRLGLPAHSSTAPTRTDARMARAKVAGANRSGEPAAERGGLHREQLQVDHRSDDEERQSRGEGELGQGRGHERVGLGTDGQQDREDREGEHRHHRVVGRGLQPARRAPRS